jgi:hypothetical protein
MLLPHLLLNVVVFGEVSERGEG